VNRSFEEPRVAAIGSYSYMITERGAGEEQGLHQLEGTPESMQRCGFPRDATEPQLNRNLSRRRQAINAQGHAPEDHVVSVLPKFPAKEEDETWLCSDGNT